MAVEFPLQVTCLAVICGSPVLAAIFVALRLHARRKLKSSLLWDDWLIVAALLLSFALIGPSVKHVYMWNVGIHIWDVVPPRHTEPKNYNEYYAILLGFNLINILVLPLAKASIILLLLRVTSMLRSIRYMLFVVLFFNMGACIVPWFIFIFMCPPLTGNTWKPTTFNGLKCVSRDQTGRMQIFITCANLFTDLLIFPIPFIIMRKVMGVSLRARLIALLLFACSLGVTGIGAAKIHLSYRDRLYRQYQPDWTYPIDYCINHIENNVAIIVACVPALRGLVARWVSSARRSFTDPEFASLNKVNSGNSQSRQSRRNPFSLTEIIKANSIEHIDDLGDLERIDTRINAAKRASGSTITFVGSSSDNIDIEIARCKISATTVMTQDVEKTVTVFTPTTAAVTAPPPCVVAGQR